MNPLVSPRMKKEKLVLNLEWTSCASRDRDSASLVCNYLRRCGFRVIEGSIFNAYQLINTLKPDVVFISNSVGAPGNLNAVKYAKSRGITVVTMISEGHFIDDDDSVRQFLWGWNDKNIMYEDLHLQWSHTTRNLSLKLHPELKSKIAVSGAVGFDKYKILPHMTKNTFLHKYHQQHFSRVVGIGCWDFKMFYEGDPRFEVIVKFYSPSEIERVKKDGKSFNQILKQTIENNPEVLFLIKVHPGTAIPGLASGTEGLHELTNVVTIKNEEKISDCINVCDLWVVYESTTALEAWMLGKQTCLINPSGTDFYREKIIYRGSPNYPNQTKLQHAIDSYYSNGIIPGFTEHETIRKESIKTVIQYDDGCNHVRAGNRIIQLLQSSHTEISPESNDWKKKRVVQMLKWYLYPIYRLFKKKQFLRPKFSRTQVEQYSAYLDSYQQKYYEQNKLTLSDYNCT